MKRIAGVTLVELLVVVAIIAALAGIVFPTFAMARKHARQATTISNLRQCGLALRIYCDDYDGDASMPPPTIAANVLKSATTCDLSDTWRKNCAEDYGVPLIGSYGYVRGIPHYATQSSWINSLANGNRNVSVLVSIFSANNVSIPVHGESVDDRLMPQCVPLGERCELPDRVVRFRLDGSAKVTTEPHAFVNGSKTLFNWNSVFRGH